METLMEATALCYLDVPSFAIRFIFWSLDTYFCLMTSIIDMAPSLLSFFSTFLELDTSSWMIIGLGMPPLKLDMSSGLLVMKSVCATSV